MSIGTLTRTRTRPPLYRALCVTGAILASGVGVLAAFDAQLGVSLLVVAALVIGVMLHPAALLGLLIVSVFIEVISFGDFTVSRIIAPLAVVVIVAAMARGHASLRPGSQVVWVTAYAAWALASGLWTVSFDSTAYLLGSLAIAIVYMAAFASLLDSSRTLRRVLTTFSVGALIIGLYAIATFFAGTTDRSDPATGDPNFFATYQLIALPITLALAAEARTRWARIGGYLVAVVLIGSVLTTLSRGGFLTLVAACLLLLFFPARAIFRSRLQKIAAFFVLLVAAGAVFYQVSDTLVPRLETIVQPGETGAGRTNEWRAAVASIADRPVLGLGYGSFPSVSNELMRRTPGVDLESFELRPEGSAVHNTFLSTLAELGFIGLVLFLGLLVSTARSLRRTARQARDTGAAFVMRVANALLVGLGAWFVAAQFLTTETSRPPWILIGLSLALPKLLATELSGPPSRGATR